MSKLGVVLKTGAHLLHYISGEGSWALRPEEFTLLDAVIETLPIDVRKIAREQLRQQFFVERTSPGKRIRVIRFYSFPGELRITDPSFDDQLFNARIDVGGVRQTAHVTFYQGFIFSIEFKRAADIYKGKALIVLEVSQGDNSQSFARSIDRLEHSSDSDEE